MRIADVQLLHVKKQQIKTYSGGMKRRISLAISAIGDPKIILLDEPTSGLDPKTKSQIWKMIQSLKHKRSMILTTHSMEEAEALSDRITIISQGQVKCIGTPIFLKNNYGDGYRITVSCQTGAIEQVRAYFKDLLPHVRMVNQQGERLIMSIPFDKPGDIKSFFKFMENKAVSSEG